MSTTLSNRTVGVVSTNPARCRDCYRCVRVCPVKAVRVTGSQAEVAPELCIACGMCVGACPQHAKVTRDDLPAVKAALRAGRVVVATVAPSIAAYFPVDGAPDRGLLSLDPLAEALTALGFAAVTETAVGAAMVGLDHGEYAHAHPEAWPVISSSCPVVINLVEQYYPDLIPHLAPQVSPMIAHGRYLRSQYGADAFIVFIGPCIAKKAEATDAAVVGAIDAVLTYDELARWMAEAQITLRLPPEDSPAGDADRPADRASAPPASPVIGSAEGTPARLFPLEGGLLGTARLSTDLLSPAVFVGSGMDLCRNVLEGIRAGGWGTALVELMACTGGCINGPALEGRGSIALARPALRRTPRPAAAAPPGRVARAGAQLPGPQRPRAGVRRGRGSRGAPARRQVSARGRTQLRKLRLFDLP